MKQYHEDRRKEVGREAVEHIQARSNGGTDMISNLCLACEKCNLAKGTRDIAVFLGKKPELLRKILAQAKAPLKDAAAVNSTKWKLFETLKATPIGGTAGLPIECGSGGRTKFNRVTRYLEKTHWLDAACVGASTPPVLLVSQVKPLFITATGNGSRQMCLMGKKGFPRTGPKEAKTVKGFQSGDMVRAVVTKGTKIGTYVGKVAIRATGSFNITTKTGVVQGLSYRYFQSIQRSDGYRYEEGKESAEASAFLSAPCLKAGVSRKELR